MRHATIAATVLTWALLAGGGPVRADGLDEVRAGNAAFAAGRYEAAVEAFTRGILAGDLDPQALAITLNNRGVARGELGDFDRAIADYAQALRLQPGDATTRKNQRIAYVRRGAAAASLGDADAALADYGEAIRLDPAQPLAYLRRGQLRLNRGDAPGALADVQEARRLDPGNPDARALLDQAQAAVAAAATTAAAAGAPAPAAPPPAAPSPVTAAAAVPATIEPAAGDPGRPARSLADVNVRAGPGNEFPVSATLARGAAVRVLGERLGWLRIRLPDGPEGYVYRKWLSEADAGLP